MDEIKVDVHVHQIPINSRLLKSQVDVRWNETDRALEIGSRRIAFPGLYDPGNLEAWQAKNAIKQAWISAPPPTYRQDLSVDDTRRWVGYLNEAMRELVADHPGKFVALPHLPAHHPELAAELAKNLIRDGHRLFSMPTGGPGATALSDAEFTSLWEVLAAESAFVLLHPPEAVRDQRLTKYYLSNLVGNPVECAVAVAHLVFGRVLERFPGIRFCIAHGGGATAMIAPRMARGLATKRMGVDLDMMPPETALRRLMVDCILHSPAALALAEQTFGSDHIVFGSDWPFPMGLLSPHEQLADLSAEARQRIFASTIT